jgi:hypothetical protein
MPEGSFFKPGFRKENSLSLPQAPVLKNSTTIICCLNNGCAAKIGKTLKYDRMAERNKIIRYRDTG